MSHEFITAIASCIAAVAGIILCFQLVLVKKQLVLVKEQLAQVKNHFSEDHRIKRITYSNEQIKWWVERITRKSNSARLIVEHLGINECKHLANNESFKIILSENDEAQKKHKQDMLEKLGICLDRKLDDIVIEDGVIEISAEESSTIRSLCIQNLNSTEAVLSAWHHRIAERKIIEDEFKFIIELNSGFNFLYHFREASGGSDAYPSIYKFIDEVGGKIADGEKQAQS